MKFQLMMAHGKSRRVQGSICVLEQDQRPGELTWMLPVKVWNYFKLQN